MIYTTSSCEKNYADLKRLLERVMSGSWTCLLCLHKALSAQVNINISIAIRICINVS